ncbi:MAG: M1 family metallopeptidase [Candidatus Obscuribacterales bacterium]|nr:M1 family metallopeptidase [Candidatus Obscuribacterales bacterium]
MFPCFDEPSYKAVFKIKVKIPAGQTAISNAPVQKQFVDKSSGKSIVEFEDTPRMSSYLLALLIGEFKATEPLESEGVPIRVWSVAHDPALGNYARDHAAKLLKYLNSYFRIQYPWKKLDLIAIPDFEAGAMENPGAITYREKFLLADEKNSSLSTKKDIVHITAHEMAHLWFGDLVTMKWWDDIWLNEAFATWMADRAVDNVMPEWNIMAEFFSNRQKALRTDSLHSTRSIQSVVVKPEDALQMFDEITYVKGAAVLRMLEYFLGESIFQDGVSAYLKEHSFGNASTDDLWKALQNASGKPVKEIMNTWCKQPGYPLVTVESESASSIKIKQERFFLDGSKAGTQLWNLPLGTRKLAAAVSVDQYGRANVHPDEIALVKLAEESVKATSGPDGIYANAGGNGFFRTAYPGAASNKIASNLSYLSPAERLCFLSDSAALSLAGKIPVEQYLEVLRSYKSETDYAVWDAIVDSIRVLNRFVEAKSKPAFAKLVRSLLQDEYKRLSWEAKPDEAATVGLTRGRIIDSLGTFGEDEEVISRARKVFAEYLKDPKSASPDILDAVSNVIAYNGGKADFETFKAQWKKAGTPELEHRNLFALAGFRDKTLVDEALALTVSKDVRSQDAPKLLAQIFENDDAKVAAWKFMSTHWAQLKKLYAPQMLARLSEAPASLSSADQYQEVKSFFATNKTPESASHVARMLERLKINSEFKKRSAAALNAWLLAKNSR